MIASYKSRGIWADSIVYTGITVSTILFALILLIYGFNEEGLRSLIRWSARISFTLFNMAFVASSVHSIFKNSFTWWWRMNRKYLGITFAIIHLVHLGFIIMLHQEFHPVFNLAAFSSLLGGGIAYFFVVSMLITSFDKIKKRVTPVNWKILHIVGGYWIWTIFLTTYLKRSDTEPFHLLYVIILLLVLLMRFKIIFNKGFASLYNKSVAFLSIVIILVGFVCCQAQQIIEGDMLIENALIVDGTGVNSAYEADLVIENGLILWIGSRDNNKFVVDTIVNSKGRVVSPGFIDIHAHGNPLKTPEFKNFLSMGVTTIALGMDGSSVKSSQMANWISKVDSIKPGVNILPFIGHGTIRNESGIGLKKDVSEESLNKMVRLAKHAMDQGCWGLSMGLEYMPGYYASSIELEKLAQTIGSYNGLITSHIRNEDDDAVESSLSEMISLSEFCNINISHLKVVFGKGRQRADQILAILENSSSEEFSVTADLYPYTASYTGIGIVFPEWAKNPKTYKEVKENRGEELLSFLKDKVTKRNGPGATLFGSGPYKGKTLADLVAEYNLPFENILRDIIGPYGASAAYFVMNEDLQNTLMIHDQVMIASDGSPTMYHPRGHGTFTKVIEDFVVKDSIMTIEKAIYKMSGQPAKTLDLLKRGVIKEGYIADIIIFDPNNVYNTASFEDPHKLAKGIDMVIMNGVTILKDGFLQTRNGTVLKKIQLPKD